MKTIATIITALALAGHGLAVPAVEAAGELKARADSNVFVCDSPRFLDTGPCENLPVTTDVCRGVPANLDNKISSISPNSNIHCTLFDEPNCGGVASPDIAERVENLSDPRFNFNDKASSIKCFLK
ncbi:hypothetical protein K469DRAFT_744648 [Zopfia rhizophila CBS 207.26]|uniref:Uncharacterized protein n=1 Tax=Zopfia rhizophila CBS 207.26 TaxID=1314779 RepID=A0A6A6EVS3_9PEZI|nr:hypothetical protein K469DRAFT_744648 [Zopfia rhizophila CBS 207.26]